MSAYLQPDSELFPMGFVSRLILDDDTLVVSAIYDAGPSVAGRQDTSLPGSGAVSVFHREDCQWILQDILKASNPVAGDLVGISLALQDDTLVVGAVGEDSAALGINADQTNNDFAADQFTGMETGAGAVYVFKRTGGILAQTAYLKPSDNDVPRLSFGHALAISDERVAVSVVGAPYVPLGTHASILRWRCNTSTTWNPTVNTVDAMEGQKAT